jgi:serine/threonine protein kinase
MKYQPEQDPVRHGPDKSPAPEVRPTVPVPPASPETFPAAKPAAKLATTQDQGGAAPPETSPSLESLRLPALFGRYQLRKLLGSGGMGTVYLARDMQLERVVALKIPHFTVNDSPEACERFYQEARAAATLAHPNLCPVYDVGELGNVPYLTMAYIEGKPLSAYIRPGVPLPQRQVAAIVRQLALAMAEAHKHHIIHRDLKPANIMINQRKQPVIMDFGLARRAATRRGARLTHHGTVLGTPAYMPPEQLQGDVEAMGPACDIYSLGVIFYELLTGRRPFDGPLTVLATRIVQEEPTAPSQFRPDLDPSLEAACLKALAKRPEDRHPSMTAFATALGVYLNAGRDTASSAGQASGTLVDDSAARLFADLPTDQGLSVVHGRRRRRSWLWFIGSGACAAAGLLILGVLLLPKLRWDWVAELAETPPTTAPEKRPEPVPSPPPPSAKAQPTPVKQRPQPAALPIDEAPKQVNGNVALPPEMEKKPAPAPQRPELAMQPAEAQGLVPPPAPPPQRLAVPPKEDQSRALEAIKKHHLREFAQTDLKGRAELARKLWLEGTITTDDSVRRYTLWHEAVTRAIPAREPFVALRATEDLATQYQVEEFPAKLVALTAIARQVARPDLSVQGLNDWIVANKELGEAALGTAEDVLAAENFDLAFKLLKLADEAAVRATGTRGPLRSRVRACEQEARALQKELPQVKGAAELLGKQPDDQRAHRLQGKLLGFTKGDWDQGLPHLAKGGDEVLAPLAARDLTPAAGAAACVERGDAWWKLAATESGPARLRCYWRACDWYERALPGDAEAARPELTQKIKRVRGAINLANVKPEYHFADWSTAAPKKWTAAGAELGYEHGVFSMKRPGGWFVTTICEGNYHCNFACQVMGRIWGQPSGGWKLDIVDQDWRYGLHFQIDSNGVLHFRHPWNRHRRDAQPDETIKHPAIKPHFDYNTLLVIVRGRQVEIYVNDVAVREPLLMERDLTPFLRMRLGLDAWGQGAEVEFKRLALWPSDWLPSLSARVAAFKGSQ